MICKCINVYRHAARSCRRVFSRYPFDQTSTRFVVYSYKRCNVCIKKNVTPPYFGPRAVHAQTPTSSHQRHALLKSTRKVADGNALPCALHPFPYETGSLYVSILMFCYHANIQTLPIRSGLLLELLRIALRRSRWCDPSFYM